MKSAIETSERIGEKYLCTLWGSRPANEMADLLHGFFMLDNSNDWEMRTEVCFLQDLCREKYHIESDARFMGAAA